MRTSAKGGGGLVKCGHMRTGGGGMKRGHFLQTSFMDDPPSEQGLLVVPFARTSTTQARALLVVGLSVWNGHPLAQRLHPRILSDTFYSSLKTLLFSRARVGSASE